MELLVQSWLSGYSPLDVTTDVDAERDSAQRWARLDLLCALLRDGTSED